jgi:uncharacterized protein (UPF0210 family)
LVRTVDEIGDEIGIRVANKRIAVTPVSMISEASVGNPVLLARAIDEAAEVVGVDFIGGYSALVHKGATHSETEFLNSIPEALASTERLCSSVNVATTRAGINMDAVRQVGAAPRPREVIRDEGLNRVEKFRQISSAVIDEAAYDPSLRFVLVAVVLFVLFLILLLLSELIT